MHNNRLGADEVDAVRNKVMGSPNSLVKFQGMLQKI